MTAPLVSTEWLEANLDKENLRIIDMRGKVLPPSEPPPHYLSDRGAYLESHVPGAVYVDWQTDIVEPGSPSNDIAPPDQFAALMSALGVDERTHAVIYDDAANMFASRLRWCLRYYGHDAVSILDGGWIKWRGEGRPTSDGEATVPPANFVPRVNPSLRATADDIAQSLDAATMQLLDVRSRAEFVGQTSRASRGGHIPSAINLPRSAMLADDMTLKPADELRARFDELGIALDHPQTTLYCNSGVSACYGMLALEAAGAVNMRIYDGSWKDWGNDLARPIAKG